MTDQEINATLASARRTAHAPVQEHGAAILELCDLVAELHRRLIVANQAQCGPGYYRK